MALPEYITPVIAAGGPVALMVIVLRFGPDAVVRLLAGAVAVLTGDEKRGERCLAVLRILRNKDDDDPPSSKHDDVPRSGRGRGPGRRSTLSCTCILNMQCSTLIHEQWPPASSCLPTPGRGPLVCQ